MCRDPLDMLMNNSFFLFTDQKLLVTFSCNFWMLLAWTNNYCICWIGNFFKSSIALTVVSSSFWSLDIDSFIQFSTSPDNWKPAFCNGRYVIHTLTICEKPINKNNVFCFTYFKFNNKTFKVKFGRWQQLDGFSIFFFPFDSFAVR